MTDKVLDASVLIAAVSDRSGAADTLRRQLGQGANHAPHLVDAEVGNVLRRPELRGDLTAPEATAAMIDASDLVDTRYPHRGPLAEAAWALRGSITFYDALYAALAATLDLPLWTTNRRLVSAPGLQCRIEVW